MALKKATKADYEAVQRLNGLHVGQLDKHEIESFNRLCEDGLARRSYEGGAGLMGVAKVRVRDVVFVD